MFTAMYMFHFVYIPVHDLQYTECTHIAPARMAVSLRKFSLDKK